LKPVQELSVAECVARVRVGWLRDHPEHAEFFAASDFVSCQSKFVAGDLAKELLDALPALMARNIDFIEDIHVERIAFDNPELHQAAQRYFHALYQSYFALHWFTQTITATSLRLHILAFQQRFESGLAFGDADRVTRLKYIGELASHTRKAAGDEFLGKIPPGHSLATIFHGLFVIALASGDKNLADCITDALEPLNKFAYLMVLIDPNG